VKRIITIQNIACVGKASLKVALPIRSVLGIECAILPTAVLLTRPMFKCFTSHDLAKDIAPIAAHCKQEAIRFDAIDTGYLGFVQQLSLVSDFKTPTNTVFIDPVVADNSKLYPSFTLEFEKALPRLLERLR